MCWCRHSPDKLLRQKRPAGITLILTGIYTPDKLSPRAYCQGNFRSEYDNVNNGTIKWITEVRIPLQKVHDVPFDMHDRMPIYWLNSLAPGRLERTFRYVIFKLISVTDGWGISCKIALRWIPLDLTDDKSTLVQVMNGLVPSGNKPLPEPMLT